MSVKIIFLDIDGVLNNALDFDIHCHLDKSCDFYSNTCVQRLNAIIKETGAKICVSSTWRLGLTVDEMAHKIKAMGVIGEVVGVTDNLRRYHCMRGNEIYKWIEDNKTTLKYEHQHKYHSYVILDDDSDMLLRQKDNFVHTNGELGLCDKDVEKAIMILNKVDINNSYKYEDIVANSKDVPNWLRELQTQHLTAEELSSVASKVAAAGEAHINQTTRIEPTEKELTERYNL